MDIIGLNSRSDNYIWVLHGKDLTHNQIWVVDPGEAKPVLDYISANNLSLQGILLTHHHYDHTEGVEEILANFPKIEVYGGRLMDKPYLTKRLQENDQITIFGESFQVFETPGHTLDHISFASKQVLFCGDVIFGAGCGRVFEGTAEQMAQSLLKLRQLDDKLDVYCGHEYTISNLNFAKIAEPDNQSIKNRYQNDREKRLANLPTIPSKLGLEKQTNPFLRFDLQPLSSTIANNFLTPNNQAESRAQNADLFANLRAWKDQLDQTGELDEGL